MGILIWGKDQKLYAAGFGEGVDEDAQEYFHGFLLGVTH